MASARFQQQQKRVQSSTAPTTAREIQIQKTKVSQPASVAIQPTTQQISPEEQQKLNQQKEAAAKEVAEIQKQIQDLRDTKQRIESTTGSTGTSRAIGRQLDEEFSVKLKYASAKLSALEQSQSLSEAQQRIEYGTQQVSAGERAALQSSIAQKQQSKLLQKEKAGEIVIERNKKGEMISYSEIQPTTQPGVVEQAKVTGSGFIGPTRGTYDVSTGTYTDPAGNKQSVVNAPAGAKVVDSSVSQAQKFYLQDTKQSVQTPKIDLKEVIAKKSGTYNVDTGVYTNPQGQSFSTKNPPANAVKTGAFYDRIKEAQQKVSKVYVDSWSKNNPTERLIYDNIGNVVGVESGKLGRSMSIENYNKLTKGNKIDLRKTNGKKLFRVEEDWERAGLKGTGMAGLIADLGTAYAASPLPIRFTGYYLLGAGEKPEEVPMGLHNLLTGENFDRQNAESSIEHKGQKLVWKNGKATWQGKPTYIKGTPEYEAAVQDLANRISLGRNIESSALLLVAGGIGKAPKEIKFNLRKLKEPEFFEVQRPLIVNGKETTLSSYLIKTEVKPPQAIMKASSKGGLLGIDDFLTIKYPKYEYTRTIMPIVGKGKAITLTTKTTKFGKISVLSGDSVPRTLSELEKLPKVEQFLWQRLAENVAGGRPISLKNVPSILSKDIQLTKAYIKQFNLGEIRKGKDAVDISLLTSKTLGKRVTSFETVSKFKTIKETEEFDILTGRVIYKDVTKPFARAAGKTPGMKGTILKIKEPIIVGEETGITVYRAAGGAKTPLQDTFKQLLVETPKPVPKVVKVPKVTTNLKVKMPVEKNVIINSLLVGVGNGVLNKLDNRPSSSFISNFISGFKSGVQIEEEGAAAKKAFSLSITGQVVKDTSAKKESPVIKEVQKINDILISRQPQGIKQQPRQEGRPKQIPIQRPIERYKLREGQKVKQPQRLILMQTQVPKQKFQRPVPIRKKESKKDLSELLTQGFKRRRMQYFGTGKAKKEKTKYATLPTIAELLTFGGAKSRKPREQIRGFEVFRFT